MRGKAPSLLCLQPSFNTSVNRLLFIIQSLSLSSGWSDAALPTWICSDLGMPTGRRETNMAIIYCVPVLLCWYTERSTDFTSGRVCEPSSSFWGVFHFRAMSRWTLAGGPPACRNLSGLGEGRTGALQHQAAGDWADLRGRSPRWQPCHLEVLPWRCGWRSPVNLPGWWDRGRALRAPWKWRLVNSDIFCTGASNVFAFRRVTCEHNKLTKL